MFWTQDMTILFQPVLIPVDHMPIDEKLNALSRLVILICVIVSLILQDIKIVLFMIILLLAIVVVHGYQSKNNENTDTFLNEKHVKVIDNKACTKPTKNNPFMNPVLTNISKESEDTIGACPVYDKEIESSINKMYDESLYRNADDIFDTATGKRQFYTVPVTNVPNDQTTFANWLYNRGETCKENNGIRCYTNMYRDLRI